MSNTNKSRLWFRDDLTRTLISIYFAAKSSQGKNTDAQFQAGFTSALSSFALAVGVDPSAFLSPEDAARIQEARS